jgi:hypothetical protein
MSVTTTLVRPRKPSPPADVAAARERSTRRRVGIIWALLILNVLTFYPKTWSGQPLLIPIPSAAGKLMTQGSLPLALLLALTVNRRLTIRPNVYMCLISLLAVEAIVTSTEAGHIGTIYRTFRLLMFVITLWLLTPFWGRRDLLLVRCHLVATFFVLSTVLLGLLVAPSTAISQGRLAGTLWPTPPPQVAEFAAVTSGLVIVLWLGGVLRGRIALCVVPVTITILLLTHTRTALIAMTAGLLVGGMSLFAARARVRRLFAIAGVVVSVGAITLGGLVTTWLARGEGTQQLTDLTGRTNVWTQVVTIPRDRMQTWFGFGLSNKSFNGLPIDSNWLATYLDQGMFGIVISASILVFLLINAYFRPRGVQRALALFLVTYCLVASFTETGFSDASTYLLEITLAASLLVPSVGEKSSV